MDEIWKDIIGYEGLYQISNFGNVRSLTKVNRWKPHILIPIVEKQEPNKGYCYIKLSKNSIQNGYRVHRLVAENFIPNPQNLPEVNHIDKNKSNNHVSNLEWCDHQYNIEHGCGVPVLQFDLNGNFIKEYKSIDTANIDNGCSHVWHCCNGHRKTSGGYIWRYKK